MKVVGIRDLKDRLSEILRYVRRKGPVHISTRGEIVAELRESYGTAASTSDALPDGIREMVEAGELRPPRVRDRSRYPVFERSAPDGTAARLLDEERG